MINFQDDYKMKIRNNTNKDQLQFCSLKIEKPEKMKESNNFQVSLQELNRIINLGCSMKVILMQVDGIKIVEDIIKTVRKMNAPSFYYKQRLDQALLGMQKKLPSLFDNFDHSSSQQGQKSEKGRDQQNQKESLQTLRQQLIQAIVQQLYNARQDALKIEQDDSSLSFATNQQSQIDIDKQINQCLNEIKKNPEELKLQHQELKKNIGKLEQQNKYFKKLVDDMGKACQEKDEKIQSLKNTISKLEELIIKHVSNQGQPEHKSNISDSNKKSSQFTSTQLKLKNDSSSIKSEGLEREVVQLKSEIQSLRKNLAQSAIIAKKDVQKQKLIQTEKESEFLALSREYAVIKKQINEFIKSQKRKNNCSINSSENSIYSEEDDLNFKVEYQLLKQKYDALTKSNSQLKELYNKLSSKEPPIMKKDSNFSISPSRQFKEEAQEKESKSKNAKKSSDSRSSKVKSSKKRLDFGSDSEIMRDIDEINRIQSMTQSMGVNSFDEIINAKQMASKIQGFEYNNSIIYKVNSSKFIQTFQSKLSLVLQYVCLLQLYFAKSFLSCIREELMMEDLITIKSITISDLNPAYFVETQTQEASFNANNSSKLSSISSPNRMQANDRIRNSQQSNRNLSPIDDLSDSAISLPNPNMSSPSKDKTRQKIQYLQMEMKEISSLITDEYLNPHELREDPEFISRVQKLKENRIAVVITNLLKENEIFKKCLNQMIKSQQNLTKENNSVYFDEGSEAKKQGPNTKDHDPKGKDKQNCLIM